MFRPRPAQKRILAYNGGFMAVSAVPGSGKTVTLAALAAQLLARGLPGEGAVLVVTYMNSAVENLSLRIHERLGELGIRRGRYHVSTLHSLARQIVLEQPGLAGVMPGFPVLDERSSAGLLERATDAWLEQNPAFGELWPEIYSSDDRARQQRRFGEVVRAVVRQAKNHRLRPQEMLALLEEAGLPGSELLQMAAQVYALYQSYVETSGGLDFDDLVWRAADLLETYPDLCERLRQRWPYILEDEAQDSVPLQEVLLSLLAGPEGNWVRVGDPNQAITSTFTAAHPRYFRAFMQRDDVQVVPMLETGRCAPAIMALANHLVEWISQQHPLPEVRERAFLPQRMEPPPPGDPQPTPPDEEQVIAIHRRGYEDRETELTRVAGLLARYRRRFPDRTLAVLVPTNEVGYRMVEILSAQGLPYDELLASSPQVRGVAGLLSALLSFVANPLDRRALARTLEALVDLQERVPEQPPLLAVGKEEWGHLGLLLRSCVSPAGLLFPLPGQDPLDALPAGRATAEDLETLRPLLDLLRRALRAAGLPVEQFLLVLATDLLTRPADLATAQQIAAYARSLAQLDPTLRLPDLAAELERVAQGRRFPGLTEEDIGFAPRPGRITVATQHRAKGLEWDLVCLVGIDRYWVPYDLEQPFQGTLPEVGNLTALAQAQLTALIEGSPGEVLLEEATREANLETIAERLRLLYVGITRARRHLQISWSRSVEVYGRARPQEQTPVLAELAGFQP